MRNYNIIIYYFKIYFLAFSKFPNFAAFNNLELFVFLFFVFISELSFMDVLMSTIWIGFLDSWIQFWEEILLPFSLELLLWLFLEKY